MVRLEVQRLDRDHDVVRYGPHAHDFFQIVVFDRAGGTHVVGGARQPVERGQMWMLRPGVWHDLAAVGQACGWAVIVGAEEVGLPPWGEASIPWSPRPLLAGFWHRDETGVPAPLQLRAQQLHRWLGWLAEMHGEVTQARTGYQHAVRALLHLMLVDAARNVPEQSGTATHSLAGQALALVDQRFWTGASVADIAQALSFTAGHLTEVVRKHTGRPLGEWILQRKMAEARSLLADTTDPISAISHKCGFNDVGYFTRQFRRHHGVSPTAWRAAIVGAPGPPDGRPARE
ncbi:MAG TPA: AraC family transcriptional regulator [Streptosporangiaceae bacterium]